MKKLMNLCAFIGLLVLVVTSCAKQDVKETPSLAPSASILEQIKKLGFNTSQVQKVDEGYRVEGDIILTPEDLASTPTSPWLIIASEEQYHTFNLVNPTHYSTITVELDNSSPQHQDVLSAALDEAVRRYNAEGLNIRFQRETGNHPDITMNTFYQASNILGSSGFPTKGGRPYRQVQLNTYQFSTSTSATNVNFIASIMAHEIGHCIVFRHTDYMNRSYSCGTGGNEGQETSGVGAVWIPGTPTGPDANSWMLACTSSNLNRPFNSNGELPTPAGAMSALLNPYAQANAPR